MGIETWWCVTPTRRGMKISEAQVERSTDASVWVRRVDWSGEIRTERLARRSHYMHYFPTESEAVQFATSRLTRAVENSRENLVEAEKGLAEFIASRQATPAESRSSDG